MATVTEEL